MYIFRGHRLQFYYCISFAENDFALANSSDPNEMPHFIWVFAVCQSTRLR